MAPSHHRNHAILGGALTSAIGGDASGLRRSADEIILGFPLFLVFLGYAVVASPVFLVVKLAEGLKWVGDKVHGR